MRTFLYSLFLLAVVSLLLDVDYGYSKTNKSDEASIRFEKVAMHTITSSQYESFFKADQALKFDDRNEFIHATYQTVSKSNKDIMDTISAKKIIHKEDVIYCKQDVRITRGDFLSLTTDLLDYNTKIKLLEVKSPFNGVYNSHILNGSYLVVQDNKNAIVHNPHFEIEVAR